ncbi:MAG: DUF2076 family protein [Acidobacteriia bacterium]|nr:DUF2076 family protein [Terriglobia bacterium]
MTDQERQMIEALAKRIQDAPAPQIDRDADDVIRRTIGARPDALYILTQTVLIQEMALTQAKAQIDELKQRGSAGASSSSFLGSTPAERGSQAGGWGQESRGDRPGGYRGSSYQEPAYQQPQAPPPQYAPPSQPSGGGAFSGFLRNAATTAAGVVAGELAFSSLASIFGHHQGGFFGGGGEFFSGGSPVSPVSETIINNYYDDDRDRGARNDWTDDNTRGDEDRYASASDSDPQDVSDDGSDVSDDGSDDGSDDYSSGDDSSYDDGSGSSDV